MLTSLINKIQQNIGAHGYLLLGSAPAGRQLYDGLVADLPIHPADSFVVSDEEVSEVSIEKVRGLIAKLLLKPFGSTHKLAFVDGALTHEAAAAMLKIVEEPPATTIIFFRSDHKSDLPATLTSRLQTVRLAPAPYETAELPGWEHFKTMSLKELFTTTKTLSENGAARGLIDGLILELREQLLYDVATAQKIEQCLQAKRQLGERVNERLLIENLLLTLRDNPTQSSNVKA